jgi:hypothetical protein
MASLSAPFVLKLLFLCITLLLYYTLETGRHLLFQDTSHAPVAAAFFATPQTSLDARAGDAGRAAAAPDAAPPPPLELLLSAGLPATSDVRGNLGEPSVVTSERVADWLADRWQAAANMQGAPIPGEHWLEIDLGAPALATRFLLDWEKANAVAWTVEGRLSPAAPWRALARGAAACETSRSEMHIVQEVDAEAAAARAEPVRHVRLVIHEPATAWGASLWRFHVYGFRGAAAPAALAAARRAA